MLNADLVSHRVAPRRDIADRPHVRCAGAAHIVADHTVVQLDAAALQPLGGRLRADADDHDVGVELGAVRQHHLLDLAGSTHLGHPDVTAHVDAFGPVQSRHQCADLLAEHRRQRTRLWFHQNDIHAHTAQARRHLAADEAGADDDRILGRTRRARAAQCSRPESAGPECLPDPGTTEFVLGTSPVAMISSSYSSSLPSASFTDCAAVSTDRAPLPSTTVMSFSS